MPRRKRPDRVHVHVYDPLDDLCLVGWDAPYIPTLAARGYYTRQARRLVLLARRLGRCDGRPLGLRVPVARVHIEWPAGANN